MGSHPLQHDNPPPVDCSPPPLPTCKLLLINLGCCPSSTPDTPPVSATGAGLGSGTTSGYHSSNSVCSWVCLRDYNSSPRIRRTPPPSFLPRPRSCSPPRLPGLFLSLSTFCVCPLLLYCTSIAYELQSLLLVRDARRTELYELPAGDVQRPCPHSTNCFPS